MSGSKWDLPADHSAQPVGTGTGAPALFVTETLQAAALSLPGRRKGNFQKITSDLMLGYVSIVLYINGKFR